MKSFIFILITLGMLDTVWALEDDKRFHHLVVKNITEENIYDVANPQLSFELDLSFVVYRDSAWGHEELLGHVKKMANIYTQCSLKIKSVKIYEVSAGKFADITTDRDQLKLIAASQIKERPLVFFVGESKLGNGTGHAWRNAGEYTPKLLPLLGTAWLPEVILSSAYLNERDPEYSTLAHELGHIVINTGHIGLRTLMGDTSHVVNGRLRDSDCRNIKKSPYVRQI